MVKCEVINGQSLLHSIGFHELDNLLGPLVKASGLGARINDIANNIVYAFGWQDVCSKFHRNHPETSRNCRYNKRGNKNDVRIKGAKKSCNELI